jgi:hypothetical protein
MTKFRKCLQDTSQLPLYLDEWANRKHRQQVTSPCGKVGRRTRS